MIKFMTDKSLTTEAPSRTDKINPSLYPWLIVGLLFVASIISFIDRQIINLLVDPIKVDLEISDLQVSLLQGLAFALFYSMMALPMGWLTDNSHRVRLIVFGMVLWSFATIMCGLAGGFASLFIARMFVGIGEAVLGPAGNSLLADYFPREKAARAMSIFASASYIGMGISIMFGGIVISQAESIRDLGGPALQDFAPWKIAFIAAALPGFLLAAVIMFTVREPRRKEAPQKPKAPTPFLRDAIALINRNKPAFLPIYLAMPLLAALQYGLGAWIPSYLTRVYEWTPVEIGATYGLIAAAFGFLGALAGGFATDALRARGHGDANLLVALISIVISFPVIVALGLTTNESIATALLVPMAFFGAMPFGPAVAAIATFAPSNLRGQIVAIYFLIANLVGLTLGPWLIAMFTDVVFQDAARVGWSIAAAAALLMPISTFILLNYRKDFGAFAHSLNNET